MDIKVYTTPTCSYCTQAKHFLAQRGLPYKEFNVMEDNDALDEMVQLTGRRNVPVIVCGSDVLVGFSPSRLEQFIECAQNQTQV
jgi:glutaredoxin-like YruB-family protein